MNILHNKHMIATVAGLAAATLLLASLPAMAWHYGYSGYGYSGYPYYGHYGSYYGGHYGHYGYYNSYPDYDNYFYNDDYPDDGYGNYSTPAYTNYNSDYSTTTYTDTRHVDSEQGWNLLASGQQRRALDAFATQASNDPENGTPKIGYALASAETGNLDRGVWAMRRAARIDPDALHYLTLDDELRDLVNHLIEVYGKTDYSGIGDVDRNFMIASLYYLLHDAGAADRILPVQDTHSSAANMDHLIQEMRTDE